MKLLKWSVLYLLNVIFMCVICVDDSDDSDSMDGDMPFAFVADVGECVPKSPKNGKKGLLANPCDVKVDSAEFCKSSLVRQCANYPALSSFQLDRFDLLNTTSSAAVKSTSGIASGSEDEHVSNDIRRNIAVDRVQAWQMVQELSKDWSKAIVPVNK